MHGVTCSGASGFACVDLWNRLARDLNQIWKSHATIMSPSMNENNANSKLLRKRQRQGRTGG